MAVLTVQVRFPKLHRKAVEIANRTVITIREEGHKLPDEGMPYKFQCLLEEVIKEPEERVENIMDKFLEMSILAVMAWILGFITGRDKK